MSFVIKREKDISRMCWLSSVNGMTIKCNFNTYFVSSTNSTSCCCVIGVFEWPAVGSSALSSPFVELTTYKNTNRIHCNQLFVVVVVIEQIIRCNLYVRRYNNGISVIFKVVNIDKYIIVLFQTEKRELLCVSMWFHFNCLSQIVNYHSHVFVCVCVFVTVT